jgi:hypothetical protein
MTRRKLLKNTVAAGVSISAMNLALPGRGVSDGVVLAQSGSDLPASFGAYFWGGYRAPGTPSSLAAGLKKIQEAGFVSTARIILTPSLRNPGDLNVYNFDLGQWEQECPKALPFLGAAVRSTFYREALSLAGFRTFVLTTYDSTCLGPTGGADNYVRSSFLNVAANADAVRSEYQDLTLALYETQRGSGKRFIISNWETDNAIYWVGASAYATDAAAPFPRHRASNGASFVCVAVSTAR